MSPLRPHFSGEEVTPEVTQPTKLSGRGPGSHRPPCPDMGDRRLS